MGITRKWVFPIIRIVILLVIAGALGKLAFFSAATASTDPTQPTGQVSEPMATVETGTITNDVTLAGTVMADPAVPIKATLAGSVKKVLATTGQTVAANTPIVTIRSETVAADGITPLIKTVTVTAGSAGILSSIAVIGDQLVAVGDPIGQVAPPGFGVTGTLQADQQYRLLNRPTEAKVAITNGPAPFTCTGLTISTPLAGATSDVSPSDGSSPAATSGGTTIHCAVPAGVTVFAGLAAKLTISGGVAENVLVVPITAVEGTAQTGVVYSTKPDGSTETRPVTLGLNDGKNVQVTTGLKKGDQILQYVPGAAAPDCNAPQQGPVPVECQGVGN